MLQKHCLDRGKITISNVEGVGSNYNIFVKGLFFVLVQKLYDVVPVLVEDTHLSLSVLPRSRRSTVDHK